MIRLCTPGSFATATMCSPSAPAMPCGSSSSAMALGVSAIRRSLNAGSTQARATTRAPLNGPAVSSKYWSTASTESLPSTPFSINRASSARTFAALAASRSSLYLNRSLLMVMSLLSGIRLLQVDLVQVRIDSGVRFTEGFAPDVCRLEGDAVHRHRLADAIRTSGDEVVVGPRIDLADRALLVAQVARQTGVVDSSRIGNVHRLAGGETGSLGCRAQTGVPLDEVVGDLLLDRLLRAPGQRRIRLGAVVGRQARQFIGHDVAFVDEELADAHEPLLVIAVLEVLEGLHAFGAGTQRGPGPGLLECGG